MTNEPPEEVGWSHHAQDVAEAEEDARAEESTAFSTPQQIRRSMPVGRFLLLLITLCIAFALVITYAFWR